MRRLLFLVPSERQLGGVITELIAAGIESDSVHLIAEERSQLGKLDCRLATVVETTEFENDMDWGIVAGGGFGLAAGLMATAVLGPVATITVNGAVVITSILGISLGGWLGKLVGEETPLHLLAKYKHALEQGGFLVLVDIPEQRTCEIHKLIRRHCPKALVEIIHLHWDRQQAA